MTKVDPSFAAVDESHEITLVTGTSNKYVRVDIATPETMISIGIIIKTSKNFAIGKAGDLVRVMGFGASHCGKT